MTVPLSDARLTDQQLAAAGREVAMQILGDIAAGLTGINLAAEVAAKVTAPYAAEVDRLRAQVADLGRTVTYFDEQSKRRKAERDQARAQVHAASTVKCWTNEDGRRFVFAEDLAFALGYTPTTAASTQED